MRRTIGVFAILCLGGCATVKNGAYQNVAISSEPAGADVSIECTPGLGHKITLTTPAVAMLRRKVDSCKVVLSKPGYVPQTVELDVVPNGAFWGNFAGVAAGVGWGLQYHDEALLFPFAGGAALSGIGFGVDAITGAAFRFDPQRIDVTLVPNHSSVPQVPSSTFFK